MKRMLPFAALFLSILLVSCADNSKKAFEFSETITQQEQRLIPKIETAEATLGRLFETGNNDSARIVSDNMAAEVQRSIDTIQDMTLPGGIKGGAEFKQESLKYFKGLMAVYTGYSKVSAQTDTAAYRVEAEKLLQTVADKDKLVQDIVTAQQKFAKDNGFKVADLKN